MARKGTFTKVVPLPDGSRKWIYGKTKEELQKKLLDYQIQLNMGVDLTNHDTFGEYAQMWYKVYKEPNLRETSRQSLLYVLNVHILPYLSGYPLRDITPMHIQMLFNRLSDKSASLSGKVKTALKGVFDTAVANNVILRSPLTQTLKIGGKRTVEKIALTPEQEDTLLKTLEKLTTPGGRQCYLFCLIGLKTGLRRGELCGLMWSDIDFVGAELTVQHNCTFPKKMGPHVSTNLKTDAAHRNIPLPAQVLAELKAERKRSNSLYVFHREMGEPLSQSAFRRMWGHTRKAKIDGLTPHILRHTYCTRLFEKGIFDVKEIQYLMGHSTPEMTLRVYTHYCQTARYADTAARVRAVL